MASAMGSKTNKRKRDDLLDFTADSLNNLASMKGILEDLEHKNHKAYMYYNYIIRQRNTTKTLHHNLHYVVPSHSLYAFSEDWDGDVSDDYFESFPYRSYSPRMIMKIQNIDKSDPVTDHMKTKQNWRSVCLNLKQSAIYTNMLKDYENLNEEVVRCPKQFISLAEQLESDPDKYFDSCYNWYYAGNGNMQMMCINWVDFLLHSVFSCVYLSEFNCIDSTVNENHAATFDCGEDNNIYETIGSSQNIIALRTKYKVFILKIVETDDKLTMEVVNVMESELPYTSISFDSFHKNMLYITTLDSKLTIVNLDRMTKKSLKLKCRISSLVDNWNSVISSQRSYYVHAAKDSMYLYDKNSNNTVYIWNEMRNVTDELHCNDVCAAKMFDENSLYIASDHHLFWKDMRFTQNNKPKVLQRWTHGMQCVPTYMTRCNFVYNKDLICLSSQWCEDTCVIPSYNDVQLDVASITIPYRPPSILQTLSEAKEKQMCLDIYNPIDGRLTTAITGNLIVENGEKYNILVQNSLGDVTCHVLFPEYMSIFIDNDGPKHLDEWSKSYHLPEKDFEVTAILNIARMWKRLKKIPEGYRLGDSRSAIKEMNKFNEKDITDAFENEEIEIGLWDIWKEDNDDTNVDQSSINLHYSDAE